MDTDKLMKIEMMVIQPTMTAELQTEPLNIITYAKVVALRAQIYEPNEALDTTGFLKIKQVLNVNKSSNSKFTLSMTELNYICLSIGCLLFIFITCVNLSSINSVFLFVSQMQIIIILPKIGAYMSKQVTLFIVDMYH